MMTLEDDLLAGEFVLGTLDRAERDSAVARRTGDRDFDAAVTAWEERLLPLDVFGPSVEPPVHLWSGIRARLESLVSSTAPSGAVVIQLSRRVRRWQGAFAAASALAACLALWVAANAARPVVAGPTLVAVLQTTNEQPAFLMRANLSDRQLAVRPVTAAAVPDKSYELWMIDPAVGGPKSLGVLGSTAASRTVLPDVPADVFSRATYAVTIEQPGGSPTGKPTTAPVFFGHLVDVAP